MLKQQKLIIPLVVCLGVGEAYNWFVYLKELFGLARFNLKIEAIVKFEN